MNEFLIRIAYLNEIYMNANEAFITIIKPVNFIDLEI